MKNDDGKGGEEEEEEGLEIEVEIFRREGEAKSEEKKEEHLAKEEKESKVKAQSNVDEEEKHEEELKKASEEEVELKKASEEEEEEKQRKAPQKEEEELKKASEEEEEEKQRKAPQEEEEELKKASEEEEEEKQRKAPQEEEEELKKASEEVEEELKKASEEVEEELKKASEEEEEELKKASEEEVELKKASEERVGSAKGVRFMEKSEKEGADEMERLEEYERKLRRNTKEALELVDRLCELQQGQPTTPERTTIQRLPVTNDRAETVDNGELRRALVGGVNQIGEKAAGDEGMAKTDIGEGNDFDVESVSLSSRLLLSPTDCLLLPGHVLLLVDAQLGLSLVSLQSRQLIKNICPPENGQWRNAQCACLGEDNGQGQRVVYVLLEHRRPRDGASEMSGICREGARSRLVQEEEFDRKPKSAPVSKADTEVARDIQAPQNGREAQTEFAQFVGRFSLPDMELIDRIEAPKWLREHVVTQCRLCFVAQTECLYLAANTPNQGFLYELNIHQGKWTECAGTKRFKNYSDLHPFAVVGPVTELLLVETNRCYVQLMSIYGSKVVHDRMLGLCERPGSLCVDERGNLFVFDRANSKVGLYSRTYLEKMGDVALVERANCRLSAREGVLAVMCGVSRELKLHRYSEVNKTVENAGGERHNRSGRGL